MASKLSKIISTKLNFLRSKVLRVSVALLMLIIVMGATVFFNPITGKGVVVRLWLASLFSGDIEVNSTGVLHLSNSISLSDLNKSMDLKPSSQVSLMGSFLTMPISKLDFKVDGQFQKDGDVGNLEMHAELKLNGFGLNSSAYMNREMMILKLPMQSRYSVISLSELRKLLKDEFGMTGMSPEMEKELQSIIKKKMPILLKRVRTLVTDATLHKVNDFSFSVDGQNKVYDGITFTLTRDFVLDILGIVETIAVEDQLIYNSIKKYPNRVEVESFEAFKVKVSDSLDDAANRLIASPGDSGGTLGTYTIGYNRLFQVRAFEVKTSELVYSAHIKKPTSSTVMPSITDENSVDLISSLQFMFKFR